MKNNAKNWWLLISGVSGIIASIYVIGMDNGNIWYWGLAGLMLSFIVVSYTLVVYLTPAENEMIEALSDHNLEAMLKSKELYTNEIIVLVKNRKLNLRYGMWSGVIGLGFLSMSLYLFKFEKLPIKDYYSLIITNLSFTIYFEVFCWYFFSNYRNLNYLISIYRNRLEQIYRYEQAINIANSFQGNNDKVNQKMLFIIVKSLVKHDESNLEYKDSPKKPFFSDKILKFIVNNGK